MLSILSKIAATGETFGKKAAGRKKDRLLITEEEIMDKVKESIQKKFADLKNEKG